MKARASKKKPTKKGKIMARPRGGGHTPQANAMVTTFDVVWSVGSGVLSCSVNSATTAGQPTLQFWTAKNPGTWHLAFSIVEFSYDGEVEGSWDDGDTGQAYVKLVNEEGELLAQSVTTDIVGST